MAIPKGTPKTLKEAIDNGIEVFKFEFPKYGQELSDQEKSYLIEFIRKSVKDYAAQTLAALGIKNSIYGTPEMDSFLETHAQKFDCTFSPNK